MTKPKTSRESKWLPLLGGSALFGYLGCVPQGSSPATGLTGPNTTGRDTLARADTAAPVAVRPDSAGPVAARPDTVIVVVRPDSVWSPDTVAVVRKGPTLGEACERPDSPYSYACTPDGVPVRCFEGKVVPGPGPQVSSTRCSPDDTLIHYFHMGFNGIAKAGAQPRPDRLVRRRTA